MALGAILAEDVTELVVVLLGLEEIEKDDDDVLVLDTEEEAVPVLDLSGLPVFIERVAVGDTEPTLMLGIIVEVRYPEGV